MNEQWDAPAQPFLLVDRGDISPPMRNERWVRTGPGALSRAWCLMELSKALAKGPAAPGIQPTDLEGPGNLAGSRAPAAVSIFQQFMGR